MTKHTALVCLFLVTSFLAPGCSDPPSDSGSEGGDGTTSGGTGSGGTNSGGDSSGGDPGSGGFGPLPPLSGACDVPLDREVVIRGQWVAGKAPEPVGGAIQPGVYDLTAYHQHTGSTNLPDDIHFGFGSAQYSGVIEFGSDGTWRGIDSDDTSATAFIGEFSTSGSELTFDYSCPSGIPQTPRLYAATASTVHLLDSPGISEHIFARRPD